MSNQKRVSHPMQTRTGVDIFEQIESIIARGSNYGQFFYSSSIGFTDPESREEKNILIKLCGYSSAATALLDNHIYCVSGRFIPLNSNLTPVLHFDNETVICLGSAENFKGDLADKASVVGFGIVISRNEMLEPGTNANPIRNLIVVLKHTDYDPVSKEQVQFKTEYKISGKKNLANTFGLFQLGREVLISGHISGYNQEQFMWTVNALSVSVASGHQTGLSLANEQSSSVPTQRRRPGLISLENVTGASPMPGSSKGTNNGPVAMTEESSTDVNTVVRDPASQTSVEYYDSLVGTPGKKRTKKAILAAAKKAKATLPSPALA